MHATNVLLRDRVEGDEAGRPVHPHVSLGLEDAPQVRRDDGERRGEEPLRNVNVGTERAQPELLDEGLQHVAEETDPPGLEPLIRRDLRPLVPVQHREDAVERLDHPGVLVRVDGDRLERERAVRLVSPDGAVGLEPADERRFRHLDEIDLAFAEGLLAMPLQLVAGAELRRRDESSCVAL